MNIAILPTTAKPVDQTIRFSKPDGCRLIIDDQVVKSLLGYRQLKCTSLEGGGLLLGRHLLASTHIAVDDISRPMRGDRRTRTTFYRGKGHEKYAHRKWRESSSTYAYIGNWHSHPEPYPTPSKTDIRDWLNVLENDTYEGNKLYFLILGTKELACWEGDAGSGKLIKLEKYNQK
ncbi:Mov34/MPN/PAD-1 family protein [Microbulbifer sp. SSSA002]|uniref:Mov34/MPN/PAD-1 family protein n=1 Tax=unclassified Microbulbifer TaxID=2619833 RepID=UPI0040399988